MIAIKKGLAILVLFVFAALISGCQTIKGAFSGAAEGARQDWESAKRADEWMRKNLW